MRRDKEARISATNAKFKDFKVGLRQFEPALDVSPNNLVNQEWVSSN